MESDCLYARLLGTRWHSVHESVRRIHLNGSALCAVGSFRIDHGDQPLARFLARLLLLPPAGDRVPVRLQVTRVGEGEQWSRSFLNKPLHSFQRARDGILTESFGVVEFQFNLTVHEGAIFYEQSDVGLRLGNFYRSIPSWIAPHVKAREEPGSNLDCAFIRVELLVPRLGLLIRYAGEVKVEEVR